uniref:RxLR effector candidate protein n=1 Tax=Peronospora matthiolae TaxID=2874970 RepID=A0AAV1V464_9STRA
MRLLVNLLLSNTVCFGFEELNSLAPDSMHDASTQSGHIDPRKSSSNKHSMSFVDAQAEDRAVSSPIGLSFTKLSLRSIDRMDDYIRRAREIHAGEIAKKMDALRKLDDDEFLSRMLIVLKENQATEDMTKDVQTKLFRRLLDNGKSPDEVFRLLGLDKDVNSIIGTQELKIWIEYASLFRRQFPDTTDKHVALLDMLLMHYSETVLWHMLAAYKDSKPGEMATYIMRALLGKWNAEIKPPAEVYNMLGKPGLQSYMDFLKSIPPSP